MPFARTPLRNLCLVALLATTATTTTACGQFLLGGTESGDTSPSTAENGGAGAGSTENPPDPTLPSTPESACGDVTGSAMNCGFCGHSCRSDSCGNGLCTASLVVSSATSVDAFTTDSEDKSIFFIEPNGARKCDIDESIAGGGGGAACKEIISGSEVGKRVTEVSYDSENEHWKGGIGSPFAWLGIGGGGSNGGGSQSKPPTFDKLAPKAITLANDLIFVADDAYHAVLVCPANDKCEKGNVALIDASTSTSSPTSPPLSFGRTIAVSPSDVAWSQGDFIRATAIPDWSDVISEPDIVVRAAPDTTQTKRILTPANTDVFWLSSDGLYHATDVRGTSAKWFTPATDFSVGATSAVYLSSDAGVHRVERATQAVSVATKDAAYTHVAVDSRGVYASKKTPSGGTAIVELRKGGPLPVAVVNGDVKAISLTTDYVYFAATVAGGSEIRRVSR